MEKVTTVNTIISLLLKQARENAGLSQTDISKRLNITSAGWGKIEKGQSSISVDNLFASCRELGISPEVLIRKAEKLSKELKSDGWHIEQKRVEEDGLLIGSNLNKSMSTTGLFSVATSATVAGGILGAALSGYKLYEMAKKEEKKETRG